MEVNKIYLGNNLEILDKFPEESIHCVATSPPFWGLRDYKIAPIIFPTLKDCNNHKFKPAKPGGDLRPRGKNSKLQGSYDFGVWECKHSFKETITSREIRTGKGLEKFSQNLKGGGKKQGSIDKIEVTTGFCKKCGAWKGQLGLEPTPELYIEHLVMICSKIKRVLRNDGTFWLNLGDSYYGSGGSVGHIPETKNLGRKTFENGALPSAVNSQRKHPYLKPKDLCMIPARVAIALQQDGWYLRMDNIWNKANPMPESVTDRPSKSHEYVFLLTKSQQYFYDAEAIREKAGDVFKGQSYHNPNKPKYSSMPDEKWKNQYNGRIWGEPTGRNKRSVWTISSVPFADAHFAVFPPELVKPAILAGTSEAGCCKQCGRPYERIIEKEEIIPAESGTKYDKKNQSAGKLATLRQGKRTAEKKNKSFGVTDLYNSKYLQEEHGVKPPQVDRSKTIYKERAESRAMAESIYPDDPEAQQQYINYIHDHGAVRKGLTIGWEKMCKCKTDEKVPCIVMDPFNGSGTTGEVALTAGRDYIGIELSENYLKVSERRIGHLLMQNKLPL